MFIFTFVVVVMIIIIFIFITWLRHLHKNSNAAVSGQMANKSLKSLESCILRGVREEKEGRGKRGESREQWEKRGVRGERRERGERSEIGERGNEEDLVHCRKIFNCKKYCIYNMPMLSSCGFYATNVTDGVKINSILISELSHFNATLQWRRMFHLVNSFVLSSFPCILSLRPWS